ncbi:MAG: methionine--tRNA ligase subunit beta, partial [Victivallales bacterium]|nr:methionine--tRNA ligase subunit beta [Victivallales bacterium]
RYNSDLANDLGNLTSRVVKMTLRHGEGFIPQPGDFTETEHELNAAVDNAILEMEKALKTMRINQGLDHIMNAVRAGNRYMEQTAPWALAKKGETERLNTVLYCVAEALRKISILLDPVMPDKMTALRDALGIKKASEGHLDTLKQDKNILSGLQMHDLDALFLRIKLEEAKEQKPEKKKEKKAEPLGEGLISFDEFFNTQLKTAKVLEAEKVEGTDKLLKLQIQVGEEKRQLVAGVAQFYTPEDMVGKNIVIVANLKPAKIRGVESQGMLLAAKDGKDLKLITIDGDIPTGSSVG